MNDEKVELGIEARRAMREAAGMLAQWDDLIPQTRETLIAMLAAAYAQGLVDATNPELLRDAS